MTSPSNANTSGLEVVAWRVKHPRHDAHRLCFVPAPADEAEPLVTATSAQAAIDAAEARADRLAKAGDRLVDALHRYGFPVSGGARVALTDRGSNEALELDEAASNFRAALQQEG